MLEVEIKIPKLNSFVAKLTNMDFQEPLRDACLLVEEDAKKRCPVETGTLRRSINTELHKNYGEVGTNLHYAPYVEFGTGLFAQDGNGRQTP